MTERKCKLESCKNPVPVDGDICGMCRFKLSVSESEMANIKRTRNAFPEALIVLLWGGLVGLVGILALLIALWQTSPH